MCEAEEEIKDYMCVNCGGGFEEIFTDEERDADFCIDCYERNNEKDLVVK
jgi:hypothetical protein